MSGKGAPGATTLAALLARVWPVTDQARVIIEADPEGGVLAARWHAVAGLTHEPGLLSLAAARDGSAVERLHRHAQVVTDGVELVAGPPSPAQAEACLRALGLAAAGALATATVPCLVDCGRLHPSSAALPWAQQAERTLLVTRPCLEEVVALRPVADRLRDVGVQIELVCVGHRPFHPLEVAEHAGVPLAGVIADDPAAAAMLGRSGLTGRGLLRTRLSRSVAELARSLTLPQLDDDPAGRVALATEGDSTWPAEDGAVR
jgi:hypothetical protein